MDRLRTLQVRAAQKQPKSVSLASQDPKPQIPNQTSPQELLNCKAITLKSLLASQSSTAPRNRADEQSKLNRDPPTPPLQL